MKKALIIGITGMDGSNLTDYLLSLDYQVTGMVRRSSYPNTHRLEHLMELEENSNKFNLIYGDVIDFSSILRIIKEHKPDEIYYLAAQSHVGISFQTPISTLEYNTNGYLNLLEILREMKDYYPKIYFAASSEMFGISPPPQNEKTPLMPTSVYGVSKVASFHLGRVYREAYKMFICNGILFNHCHSRRGLNFVTKKISRQIAEIVSGKRKVIKLGNLDSKRDEGYSPEYVKMMHKMLQQDKPSDYVISTGETHSIEEFLKESFKLVGIEEYKKYCEFDKRYLRDFELPQLLGDSSKAKEELGFEPQMKFKEIVKEMLESDLRDVANLSLEQAQEKMNGSKR